MINEPYYKRRYTITALLAVVMLIYVFKLLWIQVIDTSARDSAIKMALVERTVYPSRGLIYDRNGELLVFNQPIYDVTITIREMGKDFDTISFCNTLNISQTDFNNRIKEISDKQKNRGFSTYTPQVFASQLGKEDIANLQEVLYKFNGIDIRKRTLRDYTYSSAAHVLGSLGEVSQRDLDNDDYYSSGDYAGRDGIERTYEKTLRGEKGVRVLMRDSKGRIQGSYNNGENDKQPVSGDDITITLDIQLQRLTEELLRGKIASAVAIEPQTGEILALVSNPSWDPKLLVGKPRSMNYSELLNDPTKPLMNRATQAQYSPGSTFKTIQALVCLHEGVITKNTSFPCSGQSSKPIKCTHNHGSPVSLENGIEQSCNPYFWYAYKAMLERTTEDYPNISSRFNLWRADVMSFGLGQRFTDTDLSEQSSGSIPTEALYNRTYGQGHWNATTIRSLAIGQGEILVTPLQLANQAATIANEGYYITPHLNKTDTFTQHIHQTVVEQRHFKTVKDGMRRVMTNGTGRHYQVDSLEMCGKTGTVQNIHGKDHAIFIGFAPKENPQIAVAVVVENAGFGATWAAPVASLMMEQYLTGKIERQELKKYISGTVLNSNVKK